MSQIGARRHYAVPRALSAVGVLERLVTDVCADTPPWSYLCRVVPRGIRLGSLQRFIQRSVEDVPRDLIFTLPSFFVNGLRTRGVNEHSSVQWAVRNAEFCRHAVKRGFGEADTLYAFNAAAKELFEYAKPREYRAVVDQTAAAWRWNTRILKEESVHWSGWEDVPVDIDAAGLMSEREEKEWELADRIVCGSRFVVETVEAEGGPSGKCVVVPYPTPTIRTDGVAIEADKESTGALKVLFIGTLQLRKGIQYLWEAKQRLGDAVTVRLIGRTLLTDSANKRLSACMETVGTVSRREVADHLRWTDVLVLPTLSEGSANVCFEAQAAGVPVLTTKNAGSAIVHGHDGWIIPTADTDAMVEILGNAEHIRGMKKRLRETLEMPGTRSIKDYGHGLVTAIE